MYTLNGLPLSADEVIAVIRASFDVTYDRSSYGCTILGRRRADPKHLWACIVSRPADRLDDVEAAIREVSR